MLQVFEIKQRIGSLYQWKLEYVVLEDMLIFLYAECSARDWDGTGLLGGIPRVVVQISALTLKGPL